eukprot:CAMPEP_0172532692 /NCGR_PEP_ID=MMETSP1067-20121228/5653_1 /TAXON_ID=265564 ORGANISM="Thalassiosira punctigera, Strain Tpunct2005C2" /NCGR_SAMPLE_ID=MMETSP1067 /ASSEMBLY_ACC=CAM_ASM_000444 /LENGTH=329 /DNA_ID=CAMNT_0013317241 /DNA_START=204 /DNA_END=1193 /DNA_ORIENTATION=-
MDEAAVGILPAEADSPTKPHHQVDDNGGIERFRAGGGGRRSTLLVQPNEIAMYIQRSTFQFDDFLYFLTNVEPARFNFPKPPSLRLSDDAWAALQLRVDHAARNILDPHRYYAAAMCVAFLITVVFYAIRPGYDRKRIHALERDKTQDDDEIYDDYIQDDLWERNHSIDDVVVAELDYLNAELDKSLWIWRVGLIVSQAVLFGSVIFIAVLMERRNVRIDDHIRSAIEEIRPRLEDEGIAVEYRTRGSLPAGLFFLGKYIRPTRVVVFNYLDSSSTPRSEGTDGSGGGGTRTKKTSSFFSEDYQRRYFPPRSSTDEDRSAVAPLSYSII